MVITVQQENKASNLREHLSILQRETQIASDNLTKILEQTTVAQGIINDSNKQKSEFAIERKKFEDYCKARTSQLNEREETLSSMRADDEKRLKKYEDSIIQREWNVVAKENADSERERLCNERIQNLNLRIASLITQESNQLYSVEENTRTIEDQEIKKDIGRSQLDSQRELFAQENTRFDSVIDAKKKEIDRLDLEAKESLRQVAAPMQNLERERLDLKRLKSDIDIYQSRVQARWDFLYPGQVMNL